MLRRDPPPSAHPLAGEDAAPYEGTPYPDEEPLRVRMEHEGAALRKEASPPEAPPAAPEDPSRLSGAGLVALIVEEHHGYARRALPYLVALLAKVTACHRSRNAKLSALCDAGEELADSLDASLDVEERDLFPALAAGTPAGEDVRRELDDMYRRHREMRLLLVRIRWLADDFAAPAWGGRSYRTLMEELEALEANLLEHIHLERVLLGPRLSSLCSGVC